MRSRGFAIAVVAALVGVLAPACSLGEGKGSAIGRLDVADCWAGCFDLKPDFFASVPYQTLPNRTQLIIRIQSGSDYEEFADGLSILVDDVVAVTNQLGQPMKVALSPEVTPPGVPVKAIENPAIVHASLYLQRTCRVQNVALYAVDAVTLNSMGQCADEPLPATSDAGVTVDAGAGAGLDNCSIGPIVTDASTIIDASGADAGQPPVTRAVGSSSILFRSIQDTDPDESDASKRLNDADFEFFLADPREISPGGLGPPPPCRGHLSGNFKFYFQRGKPAQPFP